MSTFSGQGRAVSIQPHLSDEHNAYERAGEEDSDGTPGKDRSDGLREKQRQYVEGDSYEDGG